MKMKRQLLYVPMVIALTSAALLMTNSGFKLISQTKSSTKTAIAESYATRRPTTTTGPSGTNLNRKMFTLSFNGGVQFYRPNYYSSTPNPWSSTSLYPTRPYTTTNRPYRTTTGPYRTTTGPYRTTTRPYRTTTYPWTTGAPTRGVSVCLRYLAAYQSSISTLFTLSPNTCPLTLGSSYPDQYEVRLNYNPVYLKPYIRFWSNIEPEIWTRICLTVDTRSNVVQLFSSSNMSIRQILPYRYVWTGEPVIDFPGFNGQVTDVQVWDYPLRYKEVFNYMTNGVYASYQGSVLTWSSISYSLRGRTLLEDVYERQASQPIGSRRGRGRQPKGEKTREFVRVGESGERKRQQFK